ncbi:hypothetical protein HQQ81_10190 [Microbacteriaceae bacterium VKM Ac-2854]|nr:hypothetical protein [Microbacteriaceae bacterium VKM Ac-2854]
MRRSSPLLVLALLATLAGCSPTALQTESSAAPDPTDFPVASETPAAAEIFATDDDALAAAQAAFQRFLDATNTIEADGGSGTDALANVVSGDLLTQMTSSYAEMASAGVHSVGATTFDGATFTSRAMEGDAESVTIGACVDSTDTKVVDASGATQNPPDSRARVPFEVEVSATSPTAVTVVNLSPTSETESC